MNLFNEAENNPTQGEAQPSEEQKALEQQESYLAKLVAQRGENWKDPEVLAKGKLEADTYIQTLEEQIKQMREDLGKQEYSKQLLDQLQNKATESTTVNSAMANNKDNGSASEGNTKPEVSEESLKSLVEQTLTQREQQATVKQNLSVVEEELKKSFGTEAQAYVQNKAKELGINLKRMEEIASESPTAFFALLGEPKKSFTPMVQGSVRTEGVNMQASGERTWDYYQNLRRENKQLYYSPKVQQQLLADKKRLGARFGN
jgi:hypothetical protein